VELEVVVAAAAVMEEEVPCQAEDENGSLVLLVDRVLG
jgi:hypothetical protein